MGLNLLMIHGNGGANARFQLFVKKAEEQMAPFSIHLPELPGFEGRPLPVVIDYWDAFLNHLGEMILQDREADWVLYGHGIGGSMILEWAARDWALPDGTHFSPKKVIMHSIIGASLKARMFPKIMRFQPFRHFIHWMIYQPWMRKRWEQRLFLKPEAIPKKLRDQFFEDYRGCAAFPVLFDLINPVWYDAVQKATSEAPFYFIWGDKERVVAAKYLDFWQKDYPNATFEVVDGWDHFPMLETAEHYYDKLAALVTS